MEIMQSYKDVVKYFMENSKVFNRNSWQSKKENFEMREIQNFNCSFEACLTNKQAIEKFQPSLPWAEVHFQERICGYPLNPAPSHVMCLKDTNKFLDSKYQFSHTYPERYWYNKLDTKGVRSETACIDDIVEILAKDRFSRQAYYPIFLNEDVSMAIESRRVPCTLGYYFYFDEKEYLNVNYIMRSCDIVRHLNNDLYLTWKLLDYISEKLESKIDDSILLGKLNIMIFNLHCFTNDEYYINKKLI